MNPKLPTVFLYFLGALFIINLLQAHFTELIFDEAYYWYYAQDMAWGYFDHPPMVALLVKIGSFFFAGELGVRLMSCILSVGTVILLWRLIDHPKKSDYIPHFFVLVFSMTLLNAYGFLTLPDTPLLFFTALFLWVYKKFIASPSVLLAIGMGIVMAALMYSKYHAVLVILFVLLSNIKLIFDKHAWLSVVVALVCYTPHFLWLYQNDFVSIKYHLFERPNDAYDFEKYTLGFFLNLIALFGLTFPLMYWSLLKTKVTDKFTKALIYLTYGVLVFFFVSSFQRRVQTQWIIVICIPMVVLVYNYMLHNDTVRKWIYRLGITNIVILMVLRIGLVYEPFFPIVYETHGNKEWVQEIKSQIGNIPVVFENSYRKAPMYSFYSGSPSLSLNNIMYRRNQYSLNGSETKVQHKRVLYVASRFKEGDITFSFKGDPFYGVYIENFESFRKLKCSVDTNEAVSMGEKNLVLNVYNPYGDAIDLSKIEFGVAYLDGYKKVKQIVPLETRPVVEGTPALKPMDTTSFKFNMPLTKARDPKYFKVCISENGRYWGLNGENVELR